MMDKVALITPSFNRGYIIGETAESIFAQTHENWEWVIVDDGSTDDSWERIQAYAAKDLERQERGLNFGIAVVAVCVLRYLTEHVSKLPLGVMGRMLDTHGASSCAGPGAWPLLLTHAPQTSCSPSSR